MALDDGMDSARTCDEEIVDETMVTDGSLSMIACPNTCEPGERYCRDHRRDATREPFGIPDHMRHGPDCSACDSGPWPCGCGGLLHQDTRVRGQIVIECDCCEEPDFAVVPRKV